MQIINGNNNNNNGGNSYVKAVVVLVVMVVGFISTFISKLLKSNDTGNGNNKQEHSNDGGNGNLKNHYIVQFKDHITDEVTKEQPHSSHIINYILQDSFLVLMTEYQVSHYHLIVQ